MRKQRAASRPRRQPIDYGKDADIFTRVIDLCWSLFKLGMGVALVLTVAAAIYFYTRMDNEVRRHAEKTFAEHFPHLTVTVAGARVIEGRGIALYDVAVFEPASSSREQAMFMVDELLLECDAQLAALVTGPPEVRRIVAKHPQVWLRRDADGRCNLEALWPLPRAGSMRPLVVFEGGSLTISDARAPKLSPVVLREINVVVSPLKGESISADASPSESCPSATIEGTFAGPQLQQAQIKGMFDGAAGQLSGALKIANLRLGGELWQWAAAFAPKALSRTQVRGRIDGAVTLSCQFNGNRPLKVLADLSLRNGEIADPRLPRALTDLTGKLTVDDSVMNIENFRGKCGGAAFAISARRQGWSRRAPMAVTGRIANLPLDKQLYKALPELLQSQWDKFKPEGIVNVQSFQAGFDGLRWLPPSATLTGSDLSFESDKFPYRLNDGYGAIHVEPPSASGPARLDVELTGFGGGQPLHIVGQVFDPQPAARGWVEIKGRGVEVEKQMIAALAPKPRGVITEMNPRGKFDFYWRIDRKEAGGEPKTYLRLDLVDIHINYDRFQYPLRGVKGVVEANNNRWQFHQLESGGRRRVQCHGHLQPAAMGSELELTFTGQKVPLDDDLYGAVDANVQHAWSELRADGHVDFTATVSHVTGQPKPRIWASIRPLPETASIRPKFFDYRMDQLGGEVVYEDGLVTVNELRAVHGDTRIGTNGDGQFAPDGSWRMRLTGLTVDRLKPARDLKAALPPQMAIMIDTLQPTGAFSLSNGVFTFSQPASPIAPVQSDWDVQLDCHQTDLQCGVEFTNIHGAVRLQGATDGQNNYSTGELNLETAMFEGVRFTKVRGPFWVNEHKFRLGRWATQAGDNSPRRLTANVFDGTFAVDAGVDFDELPKYQIEANVSNADLERMITERFGGGRDFTGKVDANLTFTGKGRLVDGLTGNGNIHVHDADLYESPMLLRLLKTLRYGKRDASAFNEVNAKFRLAGQHVTLEQLDFLGDVVNLYGEGYTNFDHDLRLRFNGQVGRSKYLLPVVKNVVGEVNRQFMEVYVDGTLSNPVVHTTPFPGVGQLLGRRQPGAPAPLPGEQRQARSTNPLGKPSNR